VCYKEGGFVWNTQSEWNAALERKENGFETISKKNCRNDHEVQEPFFQCTQDKQYLGSAEKKKRLQLIEIHSNPQFNTWNSCITIIHVHISKLYSE